MLSCTIPEGKRGGTEHRKREKRGETEGDTYQSAWGGSLPSMTGRTWVVAPRGTLFGGRKKNHHTHTHTAPPTHTHTDSHAPTRMHIRIPTQYTHRHACTETNTDMEGEQGRSRTYQTA